MSDRIIIEYLEYVPEGDGHRAFLSGERFGVSNIRAAKALHPLAVVRSYQDGRRYEGPGSRAAYVETGETLKDVLFRDTDEYEADVAAENADVVNPTALSEAEDDDGAPDTLTDADAAPAATGGATGKKASRGGSKSG